MQSKLEKRIRLKRKIRAKISGTLERPRLSVFRSNKFIYAQLIDDGARKTLGEAHDLGKNSKEVGKKIAEICKSKKISKVIFDRNGFKYTGRIKLVADSARESGLQF